MNFLPARSLNLNHDAASGFFQVSACRIRITDVFRFACPDGREHQRDHEKEDQGGGDENAADSDIIGDAAAQKGTDDAAGGAETAGPAEICAAPLRCRDLCQHDLENRLEPAGCEVGEETRENECLNIA